jgi:hypothetical protein
MNILLLTAHDIAEYDDLRMFTDMGLDVFSIGSYSDPMAGGARALRPTLPQAPDHPDLRAYCDEQRERHAGQSTEFGIVDWAKADLHPKVIEWADVIIVHHFLEAWVIAQWERIRDKRVIWRTCGQSNPRLEMEMQTLHRQGLQIVRYSPAEQRGFPHMFAGQDDLIRFGKYPADYGPWIGDDRHVGNVTQNMDTRGEHCGFFQWRDATNGLPTRPAGTGSERLPGGLGELAYSDMLDYLRHIRTYLYTGTQPASYTLGLMEAMLSGVPVVSIGPGHMWLPDLFEGHELAAIWSDDMVTVNRWLQRFLDNDELAARASAEALARGLAYFDIAHVAPKWAAFLGAAVPA